jgi:heavy metal sensor kinase
MSLRHLSKTTKTIGFRLTAWYSTIFIVSSSLLFLMAYLFMTSSLEQQDQQTMRVKLEELSALYKTGGIHGIETAVAIEKQYGKRNLFFVRIAGRQNETVFLSVLYQRKGDDVQAINKVVVDKEKRQMRVFAGDDDDQLEVAATRLVDGRWLQVGKSTEDRRKILEHFRKTFVRVTIVLVLLGVISGAFLAFRALRPIRRLIRTVAAIDIGNMDTRLPRLQTGDELDELVRLFNEMLEKIASLIDAMRGSLDHVAHDLRTPMTRLRGIAEMALRSGQDIESYRDALSDCIEESERILKMVDSLMDISEAETGAMRLDREIINISSVMHEVADLYDYVAEDKGTVIQVAAPTELFLAADRARMRQVLANLLDNAVKYSPSGSAVHLEAHKDHDKVIITVKDNGPGIPAKDLPRIWDRLYRGDQSRSERGLGLGLSLVKAVVEAHKGEVSVSSEYGKGTVFSVCLPSDK